VPRLGRTAQPRDVHQSGKAGIIAPPQRHQTLGDKSAVETGERHHIGDRSERDQVEEP
jgi:hypothetical protein